MNDLIRQFETRLKAAGNTNAKRSVEELAAHVLGCKPLEIYFRKMAPEQQAELEALMVRAERGEPVQYIIGHVSFRGLDIRCDRRALIPRPETEQLVEQVLQAVAGGGWRVASGLRIADVGTGTGCIALALLAELPNTKMTAIDLSVDALKLAHENAEQLGLSDRIAFVQGDLLEGITAGSFDIIIANLPYIAAEVCAQLDASVREHEPATALDGGADGLDLIRRLAAQAARVLNPGGGLFLEIGFDQGDAVRRILAENGFRNVEIKKDLAGLDRIVKGQIGTIQTGSQDLHDQRIRTIL